MHMKLERRQSKIISDDAIQKEKSFRRKIHITDTAFEICNIVIQTVHICIHHCIKAIAFKLIKLPAKRIILIAGNKLECIECDFSFLAYTAVHSDPE